MLKTVRTLLWLIIATVVVLGSSMSVLAEQIGTTPEGNVIYRFKCPDAIPAKEAKLYIDWPNHVGSHPEWDADVGAGYVSILPSAKAQYFQKLRNGQVLSCAYKVTVGPITSDLITWRYKVHRDIISCKGISQGFECILRAESGCSSSSATCSSEAGIEGDGMAPASTGCCTTLANPALKGRMGRIVVAFPNDAVPKATRVAVLKDTKEVQAGYGSQTWDLLPGSYDVVISGKQVSNVTVQSGHDTNIKVGVLHVSAGAQTRSEVLDSGKVLAGGYGEHLVGLPAGSFEVRVSGQAETVTISEGQITDF
jgi:hypothetical protein